MFEWLQWFTELQNSKIFSLLLFFTVFCLILLYVFTGRDRSKRLESYKYIPFDDGDDQASSERKVNKDGPGEDDQTAK